MAQAVAPTWVAPLASQPDNSACLNQTIGQWLQASSGKQQLEVPLFAYCSSKSCVKDLVLGSADSMDMSLAMRDTNGSECSEDEAMELAACCSPVGRAQSSDITSVTPPNDFVPHAAPGTSPSSSYSACSSGGGAPAGPLDLPQPPIAPSLLGLCGRNLSVASTVSDMSVLFGSQPNLAALSTPGAPSASPLGLPRAPAQQLQQPSSSGRGSLQQQAGSHSPLLASLMASWQACADGGLMRYDVTACATRVLGGEWGFVAQLNEGRANKKRATEFRVDQVVQPWDGSKFNFCKAVATEALAQFEPVCGACSSSGCRTLHADGDVETAARQSSCSPAAPTTPASSPTAAHANATFCNIVSTSSPVSPSLILVNVSPIEYGHVLLVPRVLEQLPQVLSPGTVRAALHFAREAASPHVRVGYNSLGAYATINHLHFQAYHLAAPLPCERAAAAPLVLPASSAAVLPAPASISISRLANYPVRGFVVELEDGPAAINEASELVGRAAMRMQDANIPFNLIITDCGRRVFIWPQCYAERQAAGQVSEELLDTGVNPAVFEISGHLVLKRAEDYDAADEAWAWRLLEAVSLPEPRFQEVTALCWRK